MNRKALLLALASSVVLGIAQPATAGTAHNGTRPAPAAHRATPGTRWSPWVRTPTSPGSLTGLCSVPVAYRAVVDKVVQRHRTIAGGNTEVESKGRLVLSLSPASQPGSSYVFDISGASLPPYTQIAYVNGDFLYRASGSNLLPEFGTAGDNTGLPKLALTRGPVAILYTGTTKGDVITQPRTVVDVCALMGV